MINYGNYGLQKGFGRFKFATFQHFHHPILTLAPQPLPPLLPPLPQLLRPLQPFVEVGLGSALETKPPVNVDER